MKAMTLDVAEARVRKQRVEQRDVYAPLSALELKIRDPMAPLQGRYCGFITEGKTRMPIRLSDTALRQIGGITGVPLNFLAKTPASVGLAALNSHLAMAECADGRQRLMRLKMKGTPTLRAVLPQSFVRFDDTQVLACVRRASDKLRVARLQVDDDTCFLRVLTEERLELGTAGNPDEAYAGVDVISSETGKRPLEMRSVVWRLVCTNGITRLSSANELLKVRNTSMDRHAFEGAVRTAMVDAIAVGREGARRLADTRGDFINDTRAEITRIFRRYKLGSPNGKVGRWVAEELVRKMTPMYGINKYDLIQAFTATARGLENRDRIRLEDAMGAYLMEGLGDA